MTYSVDFRKKVLSHMDSGATIDSTSKLFSVGTTTIKQWKNLRHKTGQLMGSGRPHIPYKIDSDTLKQYIKENPDSYLNEIASHFNVTAPAIHAALKRLKITRKKSPHSTRSDAQKNAKTTLKS